MSAPSGPAAPDRDLVEGAAKQVLAEVAPEAVAVFDETAAEYHQDPQGVLTATGRDEAVGFGLDIALLTPYVLAVAGSVLGYLITTVSDAAKAEATPAITDLVHRLLRRGDGSGKPTQDEQDVNLTPEQAAQVRKVALARAHDLKLSESNAHLLADAIVGGLDVATEKHRWTPTRCARVPDPTTSRYLILAAALLASGLFVGNWVHTQVRGDQWLESVRTCEAQRSGGTTLDDRVRGQDAFRSCTADAERARTAFAVAGASAVVVVAAAVLFLAPVVVRRRRRLPELLVPP